MCDLLFARLHVDLFILYAVVACPSVYENRTNIPSPMATTWLDTATTRHSEDALSSKCTSRNRYLKDVIEDGREGILVSAILQRG